MAKCLHDAVCETIGRHLGAAFDGPPVEEDGSGRGYENTPHGHEALVDPREAW